MNVGNVPHHWRLLVALMAHPDPTIRDGWALAELADGILAGRWASELGSIREAVLPMFTLPEVQARTFAPLVCCWLLKAGERDRSIFDACDRWYRAETDVRAHDPELGWLHAIAHGADCLGMCAQYDVATVGEVLTVLSRRVVSPGPVWEQEEEARVVAAVVRALAAHPHASVAPWFDTLDAAVREQEDATVPAPWMANLRAVSSLLMAAVTMPMLVDDASVELPQCEEITERSIALLRRVLPWFVAP